MGVELRDLQLYQFSILKEFDQLCKKHHLSYHLAYGTLLGAVRHQGFIPWDDDIDVSMQVDDYVKLLNLPESEIPDGFYISSHFKNVKTFNSWATFGTYNSTSIKKQMAKLDCHWGICIDVFPFYDCPCDIQEREKRLKTYRIAEKMGLKYFHLYTMKNASWIDRLKKSRHYFVSDKKNMKVFKEKMDELMFCGKEDYLTDYTVNRPIMLKKEWYETIYLPFEGYDFPCPKGYDEVLTATYGDYMTPSPRPMHTDDPDHYVSLTEPYKQNMK